MSMTTLVGLADPKSGEDADNPVPGTAGLASLASFAREGAVITV